MKGNGISPREQKKLSEERERELIPVAREIMGLIADSNLTIGQYHARDNDAYHAVAKRVLEILLSKNVKYVDKDFIFQLVLQPFDQIKEIVMMSLGRSFDLSLEKSFGKEFRELRLEDIDKAIKKMPQII